MASRSNAGSQRSQMSESRRERLMDIQKREQLKGMLISKFKLKYGNKPTLHKYIDNEVCKFLKNDRLTEENLKNLDNKILKESQLREKKDDVLSEHKSGRAQSAVQSNRSRASRASQRQELQKKDDVFDRLSNASARSKVSGLSRAKSANKPQSNRDADAQSYVSSQVPPTEVYSELAEEDEWTAIQKFNTLLHYEEQKQALMKEQMRRKLIREELDKQIMEKKTREDKAKKEQQMYESLQEQHVALLGQREKEKQELIMKKIQQEKDSRDRQLQEEKKRKKHESREQFQAECQLIQRLQSEMEQERQTLLEKRRQEREYLQKMLQENERQRQKALQEKEETRQNDIQAQEEYTRMLDKQEEDRNREFKEREQRAQLFMNELANKVIKNQHHKSKQEEENLNRYELEREMRMRMEDEARMMRQKHEQDNMRKFLSQQMNEKKMRERIEKELNDEQASMWARDKENYEQEEKRLAQKLKDINHDNANFLQRQMVEKQSRQGKRMDSEEFRINKPLLKQINEKRKEGSQVAASSNADRHSQASRVI